MSCPGCRGVVAFRGNNRLSTVTRRAATTVPATTAVSQPSTLSMAKNTNTPPCGARDAAPKAIEVPPVTAPPTMSEGMTRSGSTAAKGMAPSEMNDAPSSHPALPASRSSLPYSRGAMADASAMARGGAIPAPITAAMTCMEAGSPVDKPAVAKR